MRNTRKMKTTDSYYFITPKILSKTRSFLDKMQTWLARREDYAV